MRNISSILDIVMSHILHFYHLAALDYLDVTTAAVGTGPYTGASVVMSPWAPQHLNPDSIGDVTEPLSVLPPGTILIIRDALVGHYVEALDIRRKAHVAAAEIDGKHPCQNAQVPGGITTQPSKVNWANVLTLIYDIRKFINQKYIPDVLTAAVIYGSPALLAPGTIAGIWPLPNQHNLFLQGYGCGNTLAWGAFPQPVAGGQKIFDCLSFAIPPHALLGGPGLSLTALGVTGALPGVQIAPPQDPNVVQAGVVENTTSSHYSSPNNLHPSVGVTTPDKGVGYTWHKAPRLWGVPCEVGPLARMVANVVTNNPTVVTDADMLAADRLQPDTLTQVLGVGPYTVFAAPPAIPAYNCQTLVATVLISLELALGIPPIGDASLLMSTLGRHGARALEAKYLADALGCGAVAPVLGKVYPPAPYAGCSAGIPIINNVLLEPDAGSDVYTYSVMPNSLSAGHGLTEAPRGALGHWVTTERRRIVNYQCVVPSTWNACGSDGASAGPIEQSLQGNPLVPGGAELSNLFVGSNAVGATPARAATSDAMINRALRALHPYDICIACSVHMVNTEGKTLAKFKLDPDGKVTKES